MMQQLLSHPDKLLIEHLSETANIALNSVQGKNFDFSLYIAGREYPLTPLLYDLLYFTVAFHDLGKATSFFQEYIRKPEKTHEKQKKSHALLSALFVFYVVSHYLKGKELGENLKKLLAVFSFAAVKRHHGKMDNLANEIFIEEYYELLEEQVCAINEKDITEIIGKLLEKYKIQIEWKNFIQYIKSRKYAELFEDFSFDFLDDKLKELPEKSRLTLFYFYQLLYSTLLFSDKNEVIFDTEIEKTKDQDITGRIDGYRERKDFNNPKSEINRLKNEAFFNSLKHLEKVFDQHKHIYSITLPTGLGKTITAFALAGKIKELTGNKNAKIVINIPFTSIIDQNFEVYAEILKTRDSNVLLKHHHLAEPKYKIDENIANYDESKFLIETWQSGVVVTTFVQLLETLFSCDKAKIMKLSQLSGSIILLDETQTVPYPLWETIREGFKILGEKYNIYFILISATQPLIFSPDEDITELVPEYKKYFRFFNRTRLNISGEPVNFDEFKSIITDYIFENPQKDILIILNTKKAAREFFLFIRDQFDLDENELYFMTTLITPFERKQIIEKIKTPLGRRKIIVSTQLVEAGVDISVDTVFRQIAPLDSIIQSAGRANRYNEKKEISDIFIFEIEELKRASNMVYGSDLLIKTWNVLKNHHIIEEKDYLELIKDYFQEVKKQSDNTSNKLLKAMLNLEFSNVDLELIKERKTESVYVQLNEKAKEYWLKYVEIYSDDSLKPWEKEARFSEIKSGFYDYVINVPIPYHREHIIFDSEPQYGFFVSELDHPSQNYHYSSDNLSQNTGYNDEEEIIKLF